MFPFRPFEWRIPQRAIAIQIATIKDCPHILELQSSAFGQQGLFKQGVLLAVEVQHDRLAIGIELAIAEYIFNSWAVQSSATSSRSSIVSASPYVARMDNLAQPSAATFLLRYTPSAMDHFSQ